MSGATLVLILHPLGARVETSVREEHEYPRQQIRRIDPPDDYVRRVQQEAT